MQNLHQKQPVDWVTAWLAQAAKEGKKLSQWVGDCCNAQLPVDVQKQLTERPPANRPKVSK